MDEGASKGESKNATKSGVEIRILPEMSTFYNTLTLITLAVINLHSNPAVLIRLLEKRAKKTSRFEMGRLPISSLH